MPTRQLCTQIQVWDKCFQKDTICFSWSLICSLIALPLCFTAAWNPLSSRYQHPGRDGARCQKYLRFHYILVCRGKALYSTLSHFHIFLRVQQIPPSQLQNGSGFSSSIPGSWIISSSALPRSVGPDARRWSQISIYVRHFVERFSGALLDICETWAAVIHYPNSLDLDPWVGTICR